MRIWLPHLALALLTQSAPEAMELDCARPAMARAHIARLHLAELEYAEDVHREVHWNALGRCGLAPGADACRAETTRRHDATWREQRAAIESRYRRLLEGFEARCRAAISQHCARGGRGLSPGATLAPPARLPAVVHA